MELSMGVTVKCYPYRTARVTHIFIQVDREEAKMFEQDLVEESKRSSADNHIVYELTNKDGSTIYVWCTDSNMLIGSKLEEGNW